MEWLTGDAGAPLLMWESGWDSVAESPKISLDLSLPEMGEGLVMVASY